MISTPMNCLNAEPQLPRIELSSLSCSPNKSDNYIDLETMPIIGIELNVKRVNAGDVTQERERCDSGVGGSLTRQAGQRRCREKWNSFVRTHRPSFRCAELQMNALSVKQHAKLKKFALVRITALLEKSSQACQKSGWNRFK